MTDLTQLLSRASRAAYLDPINGRQISEGLDLLARDLERLQRAVMDLRKADVDPRTPRDELRGLRRDVRNAASSFFDEYQLRM